MGEFIFYSIDVLRKHTISVATQYSCVATDIVLARWLLRLETSVSSGVSSIYFIEPLKAFSAFQQGAFQTNRLLFTVQKC